MIGEALFLNPVLFVFIPAAFIIGSIPFGIIFTRGRGIDIRSTGSKNIGATNVLRSAGKGPAVLTLLGDVLKGLLPVLICIYFISNMEFPPQRPGLAETAADLWPGIVGLTAVLGHMYSVFLSFKGGKGVATAFGVLIAYSPIVAGIMLLVWLAVAFFFKYSSLAAIVAVSIMPLVLFAFKASGLKIVIGIIIALFIIYRHKSNIRDLINRKEEKIGEKAD